MKAPRPRAQGAGAFTLVQLMIAAAIIVVVGVSSISTMLTVNREAATMRMFSNARAIVQRNMDAALVAPFSATSAPPILATTGSSGALYDEDGDGSYTENVVTTRSGNVLVTGTLNRTVVAESNSDSAPIFRITFQLNYTFRGRSYSYQMTSLRSQD